MGFFLSDRPQASFHALTRLPELRTRYGTRVYVSVSRKSFLRKVAGCDLGESWAPTLAAELYAVRNGVDFVRTHDVGALRRGLAVERALASAQAADPHDGETQP